MPPIRRDPSYVDGSRNDSLAPVRHLPSLSDMFDGRQMPNGLSYSSEQPTAPNHGVLPRGYQTASPAHTPSTCGSESRPPSLKKEISSGGSLSSGSSYSSYPRTPVEGSLPIHALLTNTKQLGPPDIAYATNPAIYRSMSPDDRGLSAQYTQEAASGDSNVTRQTTPHNNGEPAPHIISDVHILMCTDNSILHRTSDCSKPNIECAAVNLPDGLPREQAAYGFSTIFRARSKHRGTNTGSNNAAWCKI